MTYLAGTGTLLTINVPLVCEFLVVTTQLYSPRSASSTLLWLSLSKNGFLYVMMVSGEELTFSPFLSQTARCKWPCLFLQVTCNNLLWDGGLTSIFSPDGEQIVHWRENDEPGAASTWGELIKTDRISEWRLEIIFFFWLKYYISWYYYHSYVST